MSFPGAALTTPQLNALRNTSDVSPAWLGTQYASVDANAIVVACRVSGSASGFSYISIGYNSVTAGAIADVMVDMTILISRTNDPRAAYFVGRIHEPGATGTTSGNIYVNENSAPILNGDYIFVLDDFRLWPKLARDDTFGNFYTDYNTPFRLLLPRVTGLKTVYASWVTAGFYEINFSAVQGRAATSGATISSYLWDAADGTYVTGTSASQNPVIKFPPGERYIHLTVTDSGGRTLKRHVKVFAHDPVTYPPSLGFNGASITGDVRSGWSATCEAFTGVDTVLDETLVCFWIDETVAGTKGSLADNVEWIGRLRSEANKGQTDETYSYVADVNFTLDGIAAQLAGEHKALVEVTNSASPAVFGQITNATPWRAMWYFVTEFSTLANLCDIGIDDTSDTFLMLGLTTQGQSLLDVINDIGISINSALEFAPSGETQFVRDLRYQSTANRNAATKIANWTTADFTGELDIQRDPALTTGRVEASGGFYNSTTAQETPLLSIWPGGAQYYADGESSIARQILAADTDEPTAQTELNVRVGRAGAIANPVDQLSTQHPDAYGGSWLVPSYAYYWTWTLDDATNIRGLAYTTDERWFLVSVSISHDNAAGIREVHATYARDIDEDTLGAPGQAVHYPPEGEIEPVLPEVPVDSFGEFPIDPGLWFGGGVDEIPVDVIIGGKPSTNGNVVFSGSATEAFITQNFITSSSPKYTAVTPAGIAAIQQGLLDQRALARGAWLLDYDSGGDVSSVWYTTNVYSKSPLWTQGGTQSGKYTVIRQLSTGVAIYAPDLTAPSNTITDNLTTGLGPHTVLVSATYPFGVWDPSAGGAYSSTGGRGGGGSSEGQNVGVYLGFAKMDATIVIDLGAEYTITAASHWHVSTADNKAYSARIQAYDNSKVFVTALALDTANSSTTYRQLTFSGSQAGVRYIAYTAEQNAADGTPYVDDMSVTYTAGDGAQVAYSIDNGVSWLSVVRVGTSPGAVGGFDAARTGGTTIAAASGQTYKATTAGGAYTTAGADGATSGSQPILIIQPYYRWGSTTTKNYPSSTPDYLLGSAALVSSEALWKVLGAGTRTAITGSVSGTKGLPVGPNAATMIYGTKLAYIGDVSGTRYLFVSTNSGTSWTTVAIGANAVFTRVRRGGTTQLYLADGTHIKYSKAFNTTLATKPTPATADLTWLDILG